LRIVIIAWGSLVWDPRELPLALPFRLSGPSLPIAFSRISRDGRLTLVIDEQNGNPCRTYTAFSAATDLATAIGALSKREGTSADGIGFVDRLTGKSAEACAQRHPRALQTIQTWAAASGHDAVIWTALPSNFREQTRRAYSVAAAMDYLAGLAAPKREAALAYIRQAPSQVKSLLRAEVASRWPA